LAYPAATRLGDLFYHVSRRTRANIRDNVANILRGSQHPTGDSEVIVRGVFRNMAKNLYDLFRAQTLSQAELGRLIKVEGREHLDAALSRGKGLIFVGSHFGNVDLVAQLPPLLGIQVVGPAEHLQPEALFQYICSLRANQGFRIIPVDGSLFELFRTLRRNEVVALAADRNIAGSGIVVDFFGAPARLPDGYARLSLRTGAPLIVGFGRRLSDNTFVFHLEPPIELEATGDRAADTRAGVEKVVSIMERYVGEQPDQWVMSVPIWQTTDGP
jgi:KDO2-lipid IV(A) lauroyltransferase